ncbi:hypothetical protein MKW98_027467 [Papaver atlanticum]|uniref:Uncharacterized protein n=1 Tax=Papaver atlanticum TaxID=357466 RepID=A0AAD4X3H6_9MAGN|nr:hypothetical protein MKW98_027467 [Papaver atlanticum]
MMNDLSILFTADDSKAKTALGQKNRTMSYQWSGAINITCQKQIALDLKIIRRTFRGFGSFGRLSTATVAVNINAWSCFVCMLPLSTSCVADSYLGRCYTILFSSLIYVLRMLTIRFQLDQTYIGMGS